MRTKKRIKTKKDENKYKFFSKKKIYNYTKIVSVLILIMTKRSHDFVHLPKKKNYMEEKKEEDKLSIPSIPSVNIPFLFFINQ